jgi:paraquat-inducible protein A
MSGEAGVWLVCPRCHAGCRDRELGPGEFLICSRCGEELKGTGGMAAMQCAWAFSLAGLVLTVLANVYPVMSFDVAGNSQDNLIFTGVEGLWTQGYGAIAALVFFSAIAAPAAYLALVFCVSAVCCLGLPGRAAAVPLLRLAWVLESWNLMPVFAIACVVSVVKLDSLGSVTWESGALWVGLLALCTLLTMHLFNKRHALVVLAGK